MPLSVLALILANLIPLAGALFFDWSTFEVFALYWTESVVIGAFTILRMLLAKHPPGQPGPAGPLQALFFCIHFGVFLFVHALAIVTLIGDPTGQPAALDREAPLSLLRTATASSHGYGLWALVLSHGVSFVTNHLGRASENERPSTIMFSPYRRILAMHATLLLGALLTTRTPSNRLLLALLVLAKIIADVLAHRAELRHPPSTTNATP